MENTPTQEMINKLIEWVEGTRSFVAAQAPDYIQQYLKALLVSRWIDFIGYFALIIFSSIFAAICIRKSTACEKIHECPFVFFFGSFLCPFGILIGLVGCIDYAKKIADIYIAPKVIVLLHLKDLLK